MVESISKSKIDKGERLQEKTLSYVDNDACSEKEVMN